MLKFRLRSYTSNSLLTFRKIQENKKILRESTSFFMLPEKKNLLTVIRSPHVDKRGREQIEQRTYSALFTFGLHRKKKTLRNKELPLPSLNSLLDNVPMGTSIQIKLQ